VSSSVLSGTNGHLSGLARNRYRERPVVGRRFARVAAVLFGILAIVLPGITLATLVLLFGAYGLADGILAVVAAPGDVDKTRDGGRRRTRSSRRDLPRSYSQA
jgi:hypothetical protein